MKKTVDKKVYIKFGIIMFASCVLGGVAGYMSEVYSAGLEDIVGLLVEKVVQLSPFLLVLCTLFLIPAYVSYAQGKALAAKVENGDDDEMYSAADKKLEKAVLYTMYMTICTFTALAVMLSRLYKGDLFIDFKYRLVALAVFILSLFAGIFIQNATVKQIQQLNPEKEGNVFDTKFQKRWFDSCDEAEQIQIGKAAYKSYVATSKAIIVAFVFICAFGSIYPIGPIPALVMGGIWIVQYTSYAKEASKQEKGKCD